MPKPPPRPIVNPTMTISRNASRHVPPNVVFRPFGHHRAIFGLNVRDGRLIQVSDTEYGLRGLVCPECRTPIMARKGNKRAHHFAHHKATAEDMALQCGGGAETALHQIAKELISQHPSILLPEYSPKTSTFVSGEVADLRDVRIEPWSVGFRPDLSATYTDRNVRDATVYRQLHIEIRVTHRVDVEKARRVRNAGNPMIEIDLSGIQRDLNRADLLDCIRDQSPRSWIFHPLMDLDIYDDHELDGSGVYENHDDMIIDQATLDADAANIIDPTPDEKSSASMEYMTDPGSRSISYLMIRIEHERFEFNCLKDFLNQHDLDRDTTDLFFDVVLDALRCTTPALAHIHCMNVRDRIMHLDRLVRDLRYRTCHSMRRDEPTDLLIRILLSRPVENKKTILFYHLLGEEGQVDWFMRSIKRGRVPYWLGK